MEKDKQRKWINGLWWVVVNTFGWILNIFIAMAVGWLGWEIYQFLTDQMFIPFLYDESNRMLLTYIFFGVGWGAVIGFLQQMVLKQRFNLDGRSWIFATCIGMTLYLLFSQVESLTYEIEILYRFRYGLSIFAVFVSSTLFGTAQWVILRHTFKRAGLWILATAIALGVSPMVINLFDFSRGWGGNERSYFLYPFFSSLITGLIYSLITWFTLNLISRPSIKTLENQQGLVN